MVDIAELKFDLYKVGFDKKSLVLSDIAVDVSDTPGSDRLGPGRYVAQLDVAAEHLLPGSHEVLWKYRVALGTPPKYAITQLEVLSDAAFYYGSMYCGYVPSAILDRTYHASISDLQVSIDYASRYVESLTQRFFEPRYSTYALTQIRSGPSLILDDPIIGIEKIEVDSGSTIVGVLERTELDLSYVRVFNRHLRGMLSPDDREDPRIVYADYVSANYEEGGFFPQGSQNVFVTGVLGYTDHNNTPTGETPKPLLGAIVTIAQRRLLDPSGTDISTQLPGRIKEAKTRDQRVTFDTTGGGSFATLTGDPKLDEILLKYRRPPHVGLAG
jgi:hypothetical protein